jgi:ketosteroid isomerase-like protein
MNTLLTRAITALLVATLCLCHSPDLLAQNASYKPKDQKLYDTIEQLDAALFDAFNRQDLESLTKFFSEDIEFFDDGEGLTDYKQNIESFKGLFARNKTSNLRRELVKGSLEVYAVPNYGAIETGIHRFIHIENGKEEIGVLKFVQIWHLTNGTWKLTRVISYNH